MRIDIQIDPACTEPRIVVHTDRMTGEIAAMLEKLEAPRMLMDFGTKRPPFSTRPEFCAPMPLAARCT